MPYTAVVLEESSRNEILRRFTLPDGFDGLAHHMTIDLKKGVDSMAKDMLGQRVPMLVKTVGTASNNDGILCVIALGVITDVPSKNSMPHITVGVDRRYAKPKDSNNINNWVDITPFTVWGTIQEVK